MTNSITNNKYNFFDLIGLNEESCAQITDYVIENQHLWHKKLKKSNEDSIFIRRGEDDLPLSLQFWRDGEWMVHAKEIVSNGNNKKISISGDPINVKIYARVRPLHFDPALRLSVVEEAEKIAAFQGKEGIIQNHKTSTYPRRGSTEWNFEMFQDFYSGSLDILEGRDLTRDELHRISIDLMRGLAAIHEKRFLHEDLKSANILVLIDSLTGLVVKAVLCDLGCTTDTQNFCNPHSSDKLLNLQRNEVNRLLEIISGLYADRELSPLHASKI